MNLILAAFLNILCDRWEWRGQIFRLAHFDLLKRVRGTVFSWGWLVARPVVYIFCIWIALGLGLRGGHSAVEAGLPPYLLWLCAGCIPWFFMSDMLGPGADLFSRYRHLVNKIRFPLPCITSMFTTATMFIQLALCVLLLVIYMCCGMPLDIYLLQIPVLLVLMFAFWDVASMLLSLLSAISRDLRGLLNALQTPLFWLSGVIFHVENLPFGSGRLIKALNPITFIISGFRDALYYKAWFFADLPVTLGFLAVFALTMLACSWMYIRYGTELCDVL